jgi:hypothetical protein
MNDGFLAGNIRSSETTTIETPQQEAEIVKLERITPTSKTPTTLPSVVPVITPPPVKRNAGGGNKKQARKSNPKTKTTTTQGIKFVQPRVIQDNTNIVNPFGTGGRGSGTG